LEYITISTLGNSQDFGDLSYQGNGVASLSSSTRGIFAGGNPGGADRNNISYIIFSSTGDAQYFGDLTRTVRASTAASNSTRGLFNGGYNPTNQNIIDYITIASTGNAQDFGDSTFSGAYKASFGSSTRSIFGGGFNPSNTNIIEYVTINTTGNASDFGDLSAASDGQGGCSSSTRGMFAGGANASPARAPGVNTIEFITISSLGNSQDFGDLTQARRDGLAACSSSTRGVFAAGLSEIPGTNYNIIDYVTISTTGNAQDFGDLSAARAYMNGGASNGHGGL